MTTTFDDGQVTWLRARAESLLRQYGIGAQYNVATGLGSTPDHIAVTAFSLVVPAGHERADYDLEGEGLTTDDAYDDFERVVRNTFPLPPAD